MLRLTRPWQNKTIVEKNKTYMYFLNKIIGPFPLRKTHPQSTPSILQVRTTHLAKMSIDPKYVELTAGVLTILWWKLDRQPTSVGYWGTRYNDEVVIRYFDRTKTGPRTKWCRTKTGLWLYVSCLLMRQSLIGFSLLACWAGLYVLMADCCCCCIGAAAAVRSVLPITS